MIVLLIIAVLIQVIIIFLACAYVWNIDGLEVTVFLLGVASLVILFNFAFEHLIKC